MFSSGGMFLVTIITYSKFEVFFFSREIIFYLFFQQGHIKWIKRDIKEVYNVTKDSYFK